MSRLGYTAKNRSRTSRSERAGLLFSIGRIHRILRKEKLVNFRIGKFAPVYLTAVLEYLVAEVLEQGGLLAKLLSMDRIIPKHIRLAVVNDVELNELLGQTTFPGSGGGRERLDINERHLHGDYDEREDSSQETVKGKKKQKKKYKIKAKPKGSVIRDDGPHSCEQFDIIETTTCKKKQIKKDKKTAELQGNLSNIHCNGLKSKSKDDRDSLEEISDSEDLALLHQSLEDSNNNHVKIRHQSCNTTHEEFKAKENSPLFAWI